MEIINKKLDEIREYENNPRDNEEAVEKVANSINEFGFKVPIIIDSDGVIVAGHTRLKASRKLGLESVPCIIADDLSEEQIKAFRLADNKVAEFSSWDFEKLEQELRELEALDMGMLSFGFEELEQMLPDIIEDDDFDIDESLPEEPKTKRGDIYQLGEHRLMCGDSTNPEDILQLTDGAVMDLLVTDPPYNIAYEGGTKDKLTIENDSWENEEAFVEFLVQAYDAVLPVVKEGGSFYIWHAETQALNFRLASKKAGMRIRQNLIWVKNTFTLGRQDYQWRHEPCLYGWKDGASHYFTDNRALSTVLEADKPSRNAEHPTMKPVELISQQIENSSKIGQNVIDIFGGSGTTLISCEQLRRNCYTMELDERYCDVIVDRWEKLTGQKAILINREGM